jgi:hypothetical protein
LLSYFDCKADDKWRKEQINALNIIAVEIKKYIKATLSVPNCIANTMDANTVDANYVKKGSAIKPDHEHDTAINGITNQASGTP